MRKRFPVFAVNSTSNDKIKVRLPAEEQRQNELWSRLSRFDISQIHLFFILGGLSSRRKGTSFGGSIVLDSNAIYEDVKKACDHQRKNNIKKGRNGHSEQYSQMIAMTIKALVGVTSCEFLNRDKGSLTVLYRSTLMVNRLKIEMGIAIMYTTCQTMQNTLPWFHLLLRKSASISHETVWRSLPRENLKEPRKK